MKRLLIAGILLLFCLSPTFSASKKLTPIEINEALAFGNQWKSPNKFVEEALKPYRVQIASAWSKDSISKYVTFVTDWITVAAFATEAKRRMLPVTQADTERLPMEGLLNAVVELHGRGMMGASKLNGRWGGGSAHMVLKIGEEIVQPVAAKAMSEQSVEYQNWMFVTKTFGGLGWTIGGPLPSYAEGKITLKFSFALNDRQSKENVSVILIDADGKQHDGKVDLAKLR